MDTFDDIRRNQQVVVGSLEDFRQLCPVALNAVNRCIIGKTVFIPLLIVVIENDIFHRGSLHFPVNCGKALPYLFRQADKGKMDEGVGIHNLNFLIRSVICQVFETFQC